MSHMKGPAIFLAQFISDEAPFNTLRGIAEWAAQKGYKAVQMPTLNPEIFDLERAAEDQSYCENILAVLQDYGLELSELSTHIQGQLVAVHPAYDPLMDQFVPESLRNNGPARTVWATEQLKLAAKASANLGLTAHATFSGALMWPYVYPWPQRSDHLIEDGFAELARRWLPILDTFDHYGVDVCFELHPGEDLFDGTTFERFLAAVDHHPRANILYDPSHMLLQAMDYLGFIDKYHDRIKAFHVKDAEFRPNASQGVYCGYADWTNRAGRFRSLGDGQIDFTQIFSKLTQYDFSGWAVLEWECCLKDSEQGAQEGAEFITRHMITKTSKVFDDFASGEKDPHINRILLGVDDLS
ncbi:sugar phosphate isomerase/epimerase family protein [Vibrio mangrovi]|uniref:Inosose dehydratase n=1 Tax=Vibrio mangrovi TaxID=474394 RepID=A0A1Y6IRB9_9VIBR|nr:sugar phosphate isomerase/epimerase [Vibrio mangrovi]MDW6004161.1 sugar phosphate isomerase/epimerase [Vibrio mangrovi]SMR99042.1 Inosose dehydratase [Vibrio mangrovi]